MAEDRAYITKETDLQSLRNRLVNSKGRPRCQRRRVKGTVKLYKHPVWMQSDG